MIIETPAAIVVAQAATTERIRYMERKQNENRGIDNNESNE
jgi:hypothetical protein